MNVITKAHLLLQTLQLLSLGSGKPVGGGSSGKLSENAAHSSVMEEKLSRSKRLSPPNRAWTTTTFTECSALCGGGFIVRSVRCLDEDGVISDDCNIGNRPDSYDFCNQIDCSTNAPISDLPPFGTYNFTISDGSTAVLEFEDLTPSDRLLLTVIQSDGTATVVRTSFTSLGLFTDVSIRGADNQIRFRQAGAATFLQVDGKDILKLDGVEESNISSSQVLTYENNVVSVPGNGDISGIDTFFYYDGLRFYQFNGSKIVPLSGSSGVLYTNPTTNTSLYSVSSSFNVNLSIAVVLASATELVPTTSITTTPEATTAILTLTIGTTTSSPLTTRGGNTAAGVTTSSTARATAPNPSPTAGMTTSSTSPTAGATTSNPLPTVGAATFTPLPTVGVTTFNPLPTAGATTFNPLPTAGTTTVNPLPTTGVTTVAETTPTTVTVPMVITSVPSTLPDVFTWVIKRIIKIILVPYTQVSGVSSIYPKPSSLGSMGSSMPTVISSVAPTQPTPDSSGGVAEVVTDAVDPSCEPDADGTRPRTRKSRPKRRGPRKSKKSKRKGSSGRSRSGKRVSTWVNCGSRPRPPTPSLSTPSPHIEEASSIRQTYRQNVDYRILYQVLLRRRKIFSRIFHSG